MNEFSCHLQSQIISNQPFTVVASTLQPNKVGERRQIIVPPNLGYGNRNIGPIPAGSTLPGYWYILIPTQSLAEFPEFNTTGSSLPTWGSTSTWNWNRSWRDERQTSGVRVVCHESCRIFEPKWAELHNLQATTAFCIFLYDVLFLAMSVLFCSIWHIWSSCAKSVNRPCQEPALGSSKCHHDLLIECSRICGHLKLSIQSISTHSDMSSCQLDYKLGEARKPMTRRLNWRTDFVYEKSQMQHQRSVRTICRSLFQPWSRRSNDHGNRWCLCWSSGDFPQPTCTFAGAILHQACWP